MLSSTNVSVSVGGAGGTGQNGGVVVVGGSYNGSSVVSDPLTGAIYTSGSESIGILAQSIGGGGGDGGFSIAGTISTGTSTGNKQLSVSVGGSGGVAGDGTFVSVNSNATITTINDESDGILAQSVGGGGGDGGMALSGAFTASASKQITISIGGNGAMGGNGGVVDVTSTNLIQTTGADSHGIKRRASAAAAATEGWLDRLQWA